MVTNAPKATKRRSDGATNGAIALVLLVTGAAVAAAQTTKPADRQPATQPTSRPVEGNSPAPGFKAEASDAKAIEIADVVMKRLGGRQAWDDTRHLTWKFFSGERRMFWDRHTNRIRLEGVGPRSFKPYVVLMDLDTGEGTVWQEGRQLQQSDVRGALDSASKYWVNDSYWLLMPFKLKDTGVTLKYVGEREMLDGRPADVLELTFDNVGYTPRNKYHVYVARDTLLVEQWDCFSNSTDDSPYLTTSWAGWEPYGGVVLPSTFGTADGTEMRIEDIGVFDEIPDDVYTSPSPFDWEDFRKRYPGR